MLREDGAPTPQKRVLVSPKFRKDGPQAADFSRSVAFPDACFVLHAPDAPRADAPEPVPGPHVAHHRPANGRGILAPGSAGRAEMTSTHPCFDRFFKRTALGSQRRKNQPKRSSSLRELARRPADVAPGASGKPTRLVLDAKARGVALAQARAAGASVAERVRTRGR